jgi:5-methylcytosine-specific restriction endonuclease McrA
MAAYKRVPITKMSLATLYLKRTEAEKKIQTYKNDLINDSIFDSEKLKVNKANLKISKLKEEIALQSKRQEVSKGLLGKFLGFTEMPQSAIDQIERLRKDISTIEEDISAAEDLVWKQDHIRYSLSAKVEWLNKVNARILTLENKLAKEQALKNKAAESIRLKRQIAKGVKRNLVDNKDCPYCGHILESNAHADHIYPLAKGGESTTRNMVLVCADCNSKKSALTLQAFIKKFSLNRDQIEERLEALGKDF